MTEFNGFSVAVGDYVIKADTSGAVRLLTNDEEEKVVAFYDIIDENEEVTQPNISIDVEETEDWVYVAFWDTENDKDIGGVYVYREDK